MKKIIFVLSLSMLMACKKESGNTGVIVRDHSSNVTTPDSLSAAYNEAGTATAEETYRYVAEDGSSAHVTFGTTDDGKYIRIKSNNKTISVKHKEATAGGDVYGAHDITVNAEGDSLTITQAGNVIALKKARGQ